MVITLDIVNHRNALRVGLTHAVVVANTGEVLARFGSWAAALAWLDETADTRCIMAMDVAAHLWTVC